MHPGLRKTFNMPEIASNLSGCGLRVAIVRGRFNERVGAAMLAATRTAESHVRNVMSVSSYLRAAVRISCSAFAAMPVS